MSTPPRNIAELRKEARRLMTKASTGSEQDPNEQGVVSIPNHPDGDDKKKLQIPEGEPTTSIAVPDGVTTETKPSGAGQGGVPATRNGNVVDARFTEPNTALEKIAQEARLKLTKLASLSGKLSAPKAPTKVAAAAPAATTAPAARVATQAPSADEDYCDKLAQFLRTSEIGIERIEEIIREDAGVKVASEIIAGAKSHRDAYLQQQNLLAQEAQQKQAAMQVVAESLDQYLATQSPEAVAAITKSAARQLEQMEKLAAEHPDLLEAYVGGRDEADWVVQAMAQGVEEPVIPGGGDELDPEQIAEIIMAKVQAGELDPAVAEALLTELLGGGGEAGGGELPMEEGAADPAMAEEMPAEEMPVEEEAKVAAYLSRLV